MTLRTNKWSRKRNSLAFPEEIAVLPNESNKGTMTKKTAAPKKKTTRKRVRLHRRKKKALLRRRLSKQPSIPASTPAAGAGLPKFHVKLSPLKMRS